MARSWSCPSTYEWRETSAMGRAGLSTVGLSPPSNGNATRMWGGRSLHTNPQAVGVLNANCYGVPAADAASGGSRQRRGCNHLGPAVAAGRPPAQCVHVPVIDDKGGVIGDADDVEVWMAGLGHRCPFVYPVTAAVGSHEHARRES